MRRYASLIPLLLLVFAVNVVTPRIAQAQTCLAHDETLYLPADSDDWVTTSFTTSTECNYIVEVNGTYKTKSTANDNADAFYLAEDVCDPAAYDADHCWVGDFTESLNGFTIGTLNSQARGEWVAGTGVVSRGFQSGLFSKEDSFWLQRGAVNHVEGRSIVYAFVDGLYSPGQGATGYTVRNVVGGSIIHTTTAFDGVLERTTLMEVALTSGMRIESLASYRNAAGSPWPNPRGYAVLRSVGIWYNGPSLDWDVPVVWEESENLTFEPLFGIPAEAGWTSPYPERDPSGSYEVFYPGTGEEWRFRIEDEEDYEDNDGTLTVRVYATEDNPARQFRRPLEFDHVNSTFDWFDSNGTRTFSHCVSAKTTLNTEDLTRPVPVGVYSHGLGGLAGLITCDLPEGGLDPLIDRVAVMSTPNMAYQTSVEAYQPVHASAAGFVVEKRQITASDCFDMTIGLTDVVEGTAEPFPPPGLPGTCVFEIPNWANPLDDRGMFVYSQVDEIYLIRIELEDVGELRYLVTNPRVAQGQDIRDGCVMGETFPIVGWYEATTLSSWFFRLIRDIDQASNQWVHPGYTTFIQQAASQRTLEAPRGALLMGYTTVPLGPENPDYLYGPYNQIELVNYSDPGNSCDTTSNFLDCVSGNPQFFREGEYWINGNPSVPPFWTNPGVILEPGGRIVLPNLQLDPDTAYGASAQVEQLVENVASNGRIKITIGQSSYTQVVSGSMSTVRLEAQTHTPTVGVLYDIAIENVGENDLKVHNFCLTEGEAEIATKCMFTNRSFDMGLSGWTTGGAVVSTSQPGAVELEHGDTISQNIPLWTSDDLSPHTYTVEIEARIPISTGGQIVMNWGSSTTAPITVIPLIGFETTAIYTQELTVETTGIETFTITAYIPNQVDTPVTGSLTIFRVCILGPYPDLGGGGGVIDEPEGCGAIAYPESPDVQEVLQWHWYQIDRFNRCTFIPRLNDVYKAITKGFNQLADQFKFWQQVLYSFSHWMEARLFPWLAGYLSNIAPGTIIVDNGGECNDLFCFLTSLIDSVIGPIVRLFTDLIQQAANLLFSVIGGLLNVFVTLISQLFTLLQVVLQVFFGLVQQFIEAEPIPLPGMPDCAASPTDGVCVVWWVADNTIFSGPGAAIIPLIVSILYIEYALWVIAEIKGIITRSAEAL